MKNDLKQNCVIELKQRILAMELDPGRALDEVQLATEFGISRTPLREVLQRLAGEGFVRLEENRGAKVASLDLKTLRQFFQTAPMVYASIARLAAENATTAHVKKLKDVQREFRKSISDGRSADTAQLNHRFHETIGDMAASPYLTPSLSRLLIDHTRIGQMFYRSSSSNDDQRIDEAADQHDAMIEAFANGDPATAVELTLKHWELSRGLMERFVTPDPLPFNFESFADAV